MNAKQGSKNNGAMRDRKSRGRPAGRVPGSLRSIVERYPEIGSRSTISRATQHASAMDRFPFLEHRRWSQRKALEVAKLLDEIPETERATIIVTLSDQSIPATTCNRLSIRPHFALDQNVAAGIVAGHINECGAQASGGNTGVDWQSLDFVNIGYPIIEAYPDGQFVVTKHASLGGRVTVATVTEQLVYEMGDPSQYITPDGVADFRTIQLEQEAPDRVRVSGVGGAVATDQLKVSISYLAGYKATGTMVYSWPDAYQKARAADRLIRGRLERMGLVFDEIHTEYFGAGAVHGPLAGSPSPDLPEVELRIGVKHAADRPAVDRFTREIASLILAGPPTATGFGSGRARVHEMVAYWPALIPKSKVEPLLQVEVVDV